ncbi:AIG2-like protein [Armillaria solidipes]|uniref:Putative gamma-glutamylcyclotransferase n=1 Tax=Armillaria solidipes TaxID=1076256 RepID=A0A2H3B5F3_9AGAR|nr:AIG2-like protein [Armillaria solidipes]
MAITPPEPPLTPRPLFLYGTLRAMPLLAWALTGDSRKTDVVAPLVKPAELKGYARFSLLGKDYPALIKHNETSIVDGLLLCPQNKSQRRKLDDFEGEAYTVTPVQVAVVGEEGQMVEADIYLWNGERDAVSADCWDLDTFIKERLDDWIELFGGVQLVGDDEDA